MTVKLYAMGCVSPEHMEDIDNRGWGELRHATDREYLENLMQNWDDAGNTVYLYELTTKYPE